MLGLTIAAPDELQIRLPDDADSSPQVWAEGGQVCGYGYTAAGARWIHLPGIATYRLGGQAGEAVAAPVASVERVGDAYERTVLPFALAAAGQEVLHASGVAGKHGVVALCGDSGTGKTTLAMALATRGHQLWADDAVAFDASTTPVRALPLPFAMNVRPASAEFFYGRAESHRVIGLHHTHEPKPMAAVVMANRDEGDRLAAPALVERLDPASALPLALHHGYCFDPDDQERRQGMIDAYLDLVTRVPIYQLEFRARFADLEAVVCAVEEKLDDEF